MSKRVCCKGITSSLLIFILIIMLSVFVRPITASASIDNTDNTPPVIHDIRIDKSGMSVAAGERVNVEAKVTDDKTKVVSVYIWFTSFNSSDSKSVSLYYNAVTDKYEGSLYVTETMQAGLWYFSSVSAYDEMGNYTSSILFDTSELRFVVLKNGVTVVNPYYIELGKSSITLTEEGELVIVPATVLPKDATNKKIIWTSENPSVATVTGSAISTVTGGAITAVTNGKTKITATTVDGGIQAYCDVTVGFINGIKLSVDKLTITNLHSYNYLTVTTLPNNKSAQDIIWESSNPEIATIDQNGRVQAVSYGTATITAKTSNGKYSDSCEAIVSIVSQISLNKDTIIFNKLLSSEKLEITSVPQGLILNEGLRWSSSDSSIVGVYNGLVYPRKRGTAIITVETLNSRLKDSCTVTVNIPEDIDNSDIEPPVVTTAKIDEAGKAVKAGDTIHIRIKATDDKSEITSINIELVSKITGASRYISSSQFNNDIYYDSSTDEYVACLLIDEKMVVGLWYCRSISVTDIMENRFHYQPYRFFPSWENRRPEDLNYYSKEDLRFIVLKNDGSTSTDKVQVVDIREGIDDTVYMFKYKGETITLHADVLPITANNKKVIWSSSDSSKASVDQNGKVTAISNGLAKITATTEEGGYSSSCSVYVNIQGHQEDYTPSPGGSSSPGGSPGSSTSNPAVTEDNSSTIETTVKEGDTVTTIRTTEKKDDNGLLSVVEEKIISNSLSGISLVVVKTSEKDEEGNIANQTASTVVTFSKPEVEITPSVNDDFESNIAYVRMELPYELLIKEKDEMHGDIEWHIKTLIPTEAVIEQINSKDNSFVIVEHIVDKGRFNDTSIKISEILIEKEILETLIEANKNLTISIKDEQGKEEFSWIFEKQYLDKFTNEITDMNMVIDMVDLEDNKVASEIFANQGDVDGLVINLEASSLLPTPASVKVYIGEQHGLKSGEKAYVYIADPITGMLKSLVGGHSYKMDEEGYITLSLLESADYIILPKKADSKLIKSLRDQINVNEKMIIKSGDKEKIVINLPESLELDDTIEVDNLPDSIGTVSVKYKSSDESIVKINEKTGEITALNPGKAAINIEVTLYSGKVKNLVIEIESI